MKFLNIILAVCLSKVLLNADALITKKREHTELHDAIHQGNSKAWLQLIQKDSLLHSKDEQGNTALHLAALHGQVDCVRALLERGADANALNDAEATPLLYGITDFQIVKALLDHKADPNLKSKNGTTPLLAAANRGHSFEIVQILVEAGADVNASREDAWNGGALYRAIHKGDQRTIDFLLEKGACIEPVGKSFSPLDIAAMVGDLDTVRRLVEAGANMNHSVEEYGDTPGHALNWAMWAEQHDVAAYLIDQGADLTFAPSKGSRTSPMVWAGFGQSGDPAIAKKLLDKGLDIHTQNASGESALTYALKIGEDTELVRFLIKRGARLEQVKTEKATPSNSVPDSLEERQTMIRAAVQGAIDLMLSSSEHFLQRREACFSCHNQLLPSFAYGMARERGLNVDPLALGHQLDVFCAEIGDYRPKVLELDNVGFNGSQELLSMAVLGYQPDQDFYNEIRLLRETQSNNGMWHTFGRPPMDEPGYTKFTAWSIRALRQFQRPGEQAATHASVRRAMQALRSFAPVSITQSNEQLLGLYWGGENHQNLQNHVQAILGQQRSDGGWAQLSTLESDAWATGMTLYALHEAGGVSTDDAAFQRGVAFLLRTQFEDGSWWVKSRAWPFQSHFDGGFPHGRDQWISIAGTAWATMGLMTLLEPVKSLENFPTGQELIAQWKAHQKEQKRQAVILVEPSKDRTIDFQSDVRPILEQSCIDCHSGEKPKGKFSLATREGMLRGGVSRFSSVVLGDGVGSALIRFAKDQVEDLEMPPQGKRSKYPALNEEEINKLTRWIDEGAYWPEGLVLE
jgi:ankyrin repeat protein